jgi:very-short-patch-repair endonuclease
MRNCASEGAFNANRGSGEANSAFPSPPVGEGGENERSEIRAGWGLMPEDTRHRPVAKRLRNFAKRMRHKGTHAEIAMWQLLRDRRLSQFKFRRQVPFRAFILDFVCFDRRLVIEIDGSQHFSSEQDKIRERLLATGGFRVLRYWNNDVLQRRSSVLEDIVTKLAREDPLPALAPLGHPLPQGEREKD